MANLIVHNQLLDLAAVVGGMDVAASTKADYSYRLPHFVRFAKDRGFDHNLLRAYKANLEKKNRRS